MGTLSVTAEVFVLPTSFAQQRVWFLDQLEPGSAAYTMAMALRLRGPVDSEALRRALQAVVSRHESLRTTFTDVEGDGRPQQVVAAESAVALPVTGLTGLPAAERLSHAAGLAAEEAAVPFDLATGPLLRARLLQLDRDDHVLLLSMHHIVSDGWSLGILIDELGVHYEAALHGSQADLPELEIQYPDYAAWQREHLQGSFLEQEVDHWRTTLAGAPDLLTLPTDRPRPPVQTFRGAVVRFSLPKTLHERLTAFGRARDTTPYMVLLAAYTALLARYSGQDDIVVGTPVAGAGHSPNSNGSSGSSSTPWRCARGSTTTRTSPPCWPGCARPAWMPTATRTCRSNGSWKPCNRNATSATTRSSRPCSCCRTRRAPSRAGPAWTSSRWKAGTSRSPRRSST